MPWPKGRPRKPIREDAGSNPAAPVIRPDDLAQENAAASSTAGVPDGRAPDSDSWVDDPSQPVEIQFHQDAAPIAVPSDWRKGQLLNVRNTGDGYTVTLWPEEFDVRYPQRALKFTNPAQCQDFVSRWYAREAHDPRAI